MDNSKFLKPKQALLLLALFISNAVFPQKLTYQKYIDTTDTNMREITDLFENYLNSKPDSIYDNPYWNTYEKKKLKQFDVLQNEFQPSLYMGFPVHILSINTYGENLHRIKVQFSYCQDDGTPYVLCIANYYIKRENGTLKLYNALYINREEWSHTKYGIIDYYYPKYHQFNRGKAKELIDFIDEISKNFKVSSQAFEYYFANNFEEIQNLKGLDYWYGMGGKLKPTGSADVSGIFSSGKGENDFHEAFHVIVDTKYTNKHLWTGEGIATFLGGSRGKSLDWHLKRTYDFLEEHPEIDLNNLLDLRTIDEFMDYRYAFGGFIAKKIYQKGGWEMLRNFMNSGITNEDYYNAIKQFLGVSRKNLNSYLRKEIAEEVN
jgi:hypothetical protein